VLVLLLELGAPSQLGGIHYLRKTPPGKKKAQPV